MGLFDIFSKGKTVTCSRCGKTVKESDAKAFRGRQLCAACFERERRQASGSGDTPHPAIVEIRSALDRMDFRYTTMHIGDQWDLVLNISGKANTYQLKFICKEQSLNDFSMRIFELAHVPGNRIQETLRVLAKFQETYRFLRFTIDKNDDVVVGYDFPACTQSVGLSAVELLIRTMKMIDDIYPELMRTVWGTAQGGAQGFARKSEPEVKKCTVCGSPWGGKPALCPSCLRKSLRVIRQKRYLTGQLTFQDVMDAGKYPDSHYPQATGCIYCGSRVDLTGGLCGACKRAYLSQMMRRVNEGRSSAELNKLKQDLFLTIQPKHEGLAQENLVLGPTPSGGAYAIRLQTGTKSYIGEFDERHNEISHSYGYTR